MKAATMVKLSAALQVHGTWLATGRPPIEKLSQITNFPKDRDEEISDLVEGYANAPAEVQAIVYDILGKYMSRNKQKKLENGK